MEKPNTKDASCSKEKNKKGAEPWRCEENRLRYERNKEELILTESEEEELGSDLEEFLWTHEERLDEYPPVVQELADIAIALYRGTMKKVESEVSKPKAQPK
ncbi:hypothetical protein P8452_70023 [Trifolium repens]|jgi:hypothetical protein|nr:hypothetical protein QL285_096577 [Trifolium repens]KAK2355841.1 hypothetical protein QL285_093218 [Trifolium repens]KAK2358579.1 hypothetical protein QL285_095754 [Trifolium repens]KAK2360585.1 hypothetical protein QL285_085838 [Trifolium repens]KAK2360607.1 hypothetical protein QL285_085860 [Trifolium repens]